MKKMKFGAKFCAWIKMLHEGAQTRFNLKDLTHAINVSFSIRQGDPVAMILFILYIEPFLLYLEKTLSGLHISGIPWVSFYGIFTDTVEDFEKIDHAVVKFEALSGAILSRNRKCKILGLGGWRMRRNWPLAYLQADEEIKIFGIYVRDSYRSMVKRNWDYRFDKFQNCVLSWSSKFLPSLRVRVEVLNIFALSRV